MNFISTHIGLLLLFLIGSILSSCASPSLLSPPSSSYTFVIYPLSNQLIQELPVQIDFYDASLENFETASRIIEFKSVSPPPALNPLTIFNFKQSVPLFEVSLEAQIRSSFFSSALQIPFPVFNLTHLKF